MTVVFGKKDSIALPKLTISNDVISSEVLYTKPSYNMFYSKYGFVFPLDGGGMTFTRFTDCNFPIADKDLPKLETEHHYLLVDREGLLWKIVVYNFPNEKSQISYFSIDLTTDGWWVLISQSREPHANRDLLIGFLSTEPTQKEIDEFCVKYDKARSYTWLNITDILIRIHELHPNDNLDPKDTEITLKKTLT